MLEAMLQAMLQAMGRFNLEVAAEDRVADAVAPEDALNHAADAAAKWFI